MEIVNRVKVDSSLNTRCQKNFFPMCISQGDFYVLNQFDSRLTHGTFFFPHNSEDDLKQVRKEEGIPDIVEDDHGDEKR